MTFKHGANASALWWFLSTEQLGIRWIIVLNSDFPRLPVTSWVLSWYSHHWLPFTFKIWLICIRCILWLTGRLFRVFIFKSHRFLLRLPSSVWNQWYSVHQREPFGQFHLWTLVLEKSTQSHLGYWPRWVVQSLHYESWHRAASWRLDQHPRNQHQPGECKSSSHSVHSTDHPPNSDSWWHFSKITSQTLLWASLQLLRYTCNKVMVEIQVDLWNHIVKPSWLLNLTSHVKIT